MTKKIQNDYSVIKRLFLAMTVLFGVRFAFGCCGGWGEDTLHSLSYSPNLEVYVANISPSTGESGDMVWEWQVYDKDLKYKATIMFGDRGSSLFVPPDQTVSVELKSVLDRTQLKVSSGCAQATKQEGTYSYNYWPQECLGTLNKIVTTELGLQVLKASSDCGLHGIQKGRAGVDIVYRDPETKNDLIAETITAGGAIKSVKCYQQGATVVVDARLSSGRCTPVERSNFFLFDKNKIGYLKDNIQGYRALQQKDFSTARKYLTSSVAANPSYNHSNFNLACLLSLSSAPFGDGKKYLESILEQAKYRRRYFEKISTDSDLAFWRADPAFDAWLQDYKNRKIMTTDDILKSSLKPTERRARDLNEKGLDAVVNYEYETAIDFFQQAVQQDPKFVGACVNLASTLSVDATEGALTAALDQLGRCAKMDLPFTQMRMKHAWEFQNIRNDQRFQDLLAKKL